jgi:hypothetical protein
LVLRFDGGFALRFAARQFPEDEHGEDLGGAEPARNHRRKRTPGTKASYPAPLSIARPRRVRPGAAVSPVLSAALSSVILKMMEPEPFEQKLRQLLRQEPFQPFVVELVDGRLIWITEPKLAMGGGGASFFTPSFDLVEFVCEEVRAFRLLVPGAAV